MATMCAIKCAVNGSQLELDSGHQGLNEVRTGEFEYELDIDNNETVIFKIDDFTSGGSTYTVFVTAVRTGSAASETWTYSGAGCVSAEETKEAELTLTVTASPSSGSAVTGGGVVRIQPKGKPD